MERSLLSSKELASSYDEVVWMYLFQDFSENEADLTAQRVAIRFGISSWPQHFLVDPHDLEVLGDTGRTLESFRAAVARTKVRSRKADPSAEELAKADVLAAKLRKKKSVRSALKNLQHADVVVRFRAVEVLAKEKPASLVEMAPGLLSVEHDQTRFLVCKVLAEHGNEAAAPALESILNDPGKSKNPNVARSNAVSALARCGTAGSLDAIRPHAVSGAYFNVLTKRALDAVVAIVERHPKAKRTARELLKEAFPAAPGPDDSPRERTACIALAKKVHAALREVTGKKLPFPADYDEKGRARLVEKW